MSLKFLRTDKTYVLQIESDVGIAVWLEVLVVAKNCWIAAEANEPVFLQMSCLLSTES